MENYDLSFRGVVLASAAVALTTYFIELRFFGQLMKDHRKNPITNLHEARFKAFGIANAFTTELEEVHKDFVAKVNLKLRMNDEQWIAVTKQASEYLEKLIPQIQCSDGSLPLETLMQTYVFKLVIKHFFPNMDEMTVKDIQYITSNINSLWMASKDCSLEPLPQKKALLEQLSNIFSIFPPLDPNGDSRNPLNIILPAYETLWRVVLRCFLEVHFRATSNQAEMQDSLNSLMSCPTQETFEDVSAEGISAKVIVREALRLYPPTRRIHRLISPINPVPHGPWYQLLNLLDMAPTNDPEVIHAIDVEHLHRTPEIWGEDSLTFNPSRTHDAKQVGFMPFGARPFVCPAGNSFAPMMIGICVGALIKAFPDDAEGEGWKLMDVEGKRVDLAKIDGPLDNGREGFSGLVLTRC